jgi:hypothetical protein
MNILQMLMARRMQQNYGGGGMQAANTGCGCISGLFGMVITLVVLGASGYFGWKIYDDSMDVVDESLDQADDAIEDALDEFRSGEVSGIGYEGTYECEAGSNGLVATVTLTNTDTVPHTFDLSWSVFASPTGFDSDGDLDLGDLTDPDNFDIPEMDELTDTFTDSFTVEPGASVDKTYESESITDEHVGCSSPTLLTDMPGSVPATPVEPPTSVPG